MGERSCCGTLCSMPHEQWCKWIPEEKGGNNENV